MDSQPMDEKELVILLARKIDNALNDEDGDISDVRRENFKRYYGKPYGDEEDGRSEFTTREAFEAVEWAIPSVLRVLAGNERAVEFEALSEQDEQQAQDETDIIRHHVQRKNNGFLNLYTWTKDILMNPNGYMKAYVEEKTEVVTETYTGVADLSVFDNEETDIIEADNYSEEVDVGGGQMVKAELYNVKAKTTRKVNRVQIKPVPPDEMLVDDELYSVDLDEAGFLCHRVSKTISELVEMGYDADELYLLGEPRDHEWNDERIERLFYEEENPDSEDDEKGALKRLWVHECYLKVDYDGDDIAEMRKVTMIGHEIFENEETNYQPFISTSAIIMPHKHAGMSYIEAVEDLQLVKTVLTRQMLDNIYQHTDKRHFFDFNAMLPDNSTMDNYLDATSTMIPINGPPTQAVMPEQTSSITPELLSTIQHFDEMGQLRTGVAPQLSLDPSVLQDSTMGAFMGALDQASQRLETLVRIIAETGLKPMYKKVHYLMREFANDVVSMKVRGSWLNSNPKEWQQRDDVIVNVGLGNTNKQVKLQLLEKLMGIQREVLQPQGMAGPQEVYTVVEEFVEAAGVGGMSKYAIDPTQQGWQPPQPQPSAQDQALMTQAQTLVQREQIRGQEVQLAAQAKTMEHQRQMQEFQLKVAKEKAGWDRERAELMAKADEAESRLKLDGAKAVADIRHTNEDAALKDAQRQKTLTEVDGAVVDQQRQTFDLSEEKAIASDLITLATTEGEADEPETTTAE